MRYEPHISKIEPVNAPLKFHHNFKNVFLYGAVTVMHVERGRLVGEINNEREREREREINNFGFVASMFFDNNCFAHCRFCMQC